MSFVFLVYSFNLQSLLEQFFFISVCPSDLWEPQDHKAKHGITWLHVCEQEHGVASGKRDLSPIQVTCLLTSCFFCFFFQHLLFDNIPMCVLCLCFRQRQTLGCFGKNSSISLSRMIALQLDRPVGTGRT